MTKAKGVLAVIFVLLLLLGSGTPFLSSISLVRAQDDGYESITPELVEQLAEIYQEKQALTPVQKKIDQGILEIAQEAKERVLKLLPGEKRRLRELSTPLLRIDDEGSIEAKLDVTNQTEEQLQQLRDLGMDIRLKLPKYGIVEGSLPYDRVEAVAGLDFVVSVGNPGYAIHNTGDVTSGGDTVLRAAEARAAFGVDGSGVKVGVISDGVDNWAASVPSGDLPSSIEVLKAGSGDEGTAMLEIVHDLAPGAPLAFYSPTTASDMVFGIGNLTAAGCKVIVDDLTFFIEPKFEDGPIALEARSFCTSGGVYVTSAGNSAHRHYMSTYNRDGQVTVTIGGNQYLYYAHDYGSGDIGNTFDVDPGQTIITVLQWNNLWGSSGDDFDLFLVSGSTILRYSRYVQDGNDNPWEYISWKNNTGSTVEVFIAVLEYSLASSPPSSLVLDYNVYNGSGLEYVTPEDSLIGHAAVEEVLSTAAADVSTPDTIEYFSSRGPATIYFPNAESRQVPNITGVDGVQTKTGQLGYFYNPFYGTSASAPHVAAIAALVWEADTTLTSSEVFTAIASTAVDLPPDGWDGTWGFGRVDAYEAVASVVTQPPSVITNSATSVGTTTATLNGTIADDGGEACEYRFEYDTDSGELYTYNTSWKGSKTTGQSFSEEITGLSPATTYYFRAQAKNSAGTGSGSELSFVTAAEIISFTVTDYGNNDIQFGSVDPGVSDQPGDWGDSQGTVTLTVGAETSVSVNVRLRGTDFAGPDTISIENVKYNDSASTSGADVLTTNYVIWYTVTPPLSEDHIRQVYYWISIPNGKEPGTYTSTFYYQAIKLE